MNSHFSPLLSSLLRTTAVMAGLTLCIPAGTSLAGEVPVELNEGWNFSKGQEYPGAAGALEPGSEDETMVLSYDFSNGGRYVAAAKSLDQAGEISGVEVTASGPGGNLAVALVDDTNQNLLYRLGQLGEEARTFEPDLGRPSTSYGGADDKTLHFPIKSIRLVVEKTEASPEGKITVSSVILRTP